MNLFEDAKQKKPLAVWICTMLGIAAFCTAFALLCAFVALMWGLFHFIFVAVVIVLIISLWITSSILNY